jgi:hypothetical protein
MRRIHAVLSAGVVVFGLSAFGGIASAAPSASGFGRGSSGAAAGLAPSAKPKPGAVWTVELDVPNQNSCEILTFGAGGTFTSDIFQSSGTYATSGIKIKLVWTGSAIDQGLTFKGTQISKKEYTGKYGGSTPLTGDKGQLVKGELTSWDGSTC